MKRFPPLSSRIIFAVVVCFLFYAVRVDSARANAAPPPDPTIGSAGPYQPQKTNVQMMSETVYIKVPSHTIAPIDSQQIAVSANFTLRNQGKTEEKMAVIFPLTRLSEYSEEQALYNVDRASFVVKVNGQRTQYTEITTPAEKGYTLEHENNSAAPTSGFLPSVRWAAFEVVFPVQQDVLLQIEYSMLATYDAYFHAVHYIVETGAGWYGDILFADFILRLPYAATEETIERANPGYVLSGNEIRWHFENLEPKRKDNLWVRVVSTRTWRTILELRARLERDPNDADGWAELGEIYWGLGYDFYYTGPEGEYGVDSQHFADLSAVAYKHAVDLRPKWGEARFKLAESLWFSNPTVISRFLRYAEEKGEVRRDDPAIQRVLRELELAELYGIPEDLRWEAIWFVKYINIALPELNLAFLRVVPNTPSPTITPLVLLQPTHTATPLPPKIESKPSPSAMYVGLAAGLLLLFAALIRRLRSK